MHLVCLQLVRSEESRSNGISTRIVKGGVETVSGEYKEFGYASAGLVNGYASDQLAEKFVELTQSLDGVERVCDLGCGNGYIASRLGALGVEVTGIDASLSGVKIANQNYASDKIRFVKAEFGPDLTDALALRGQFDLVVSSDVIEHLSDVIEHLVPAGGIAGNRRNATQARRLFDHRHPLSRISQESCAEYSGWVGCSPHGGLGWRTYQILQRQDPIDSGGAPWF